MKIAITSDHRGYTLKNKIKKYLNKKGYEVIDFGPEKKDTVDYPIMAFKMSQDIVKENYDFGIALCGTGIGISIACNKVKGVRCAKVNNVKETILTKKDNNANIIAISGEMPRYKALDIIDAFIKTSYVPNERFERRIKEISDYENGDLS
ncbi:MAG: RpiB/LacA/LacB family sugar-phosphate isomerase [Bacilli bacterium]|nr:RpiB/LacA/LacB family sugar-phosphate isomerase [Bacilli bacterium]